MEKAGSTAVEVGKFRRDNEFGIGEVGAEGQRDASTPPRRKYATAVRCGGEPGIQRAQDVKVCSRWLGNRFEKAVRKKRTNFRIRELS